MTHDHHEGSAHSHVEARFLVLGLLVIVAFMVVEVVVGIASGSLVLITDAAHMLTDAAALGLAVFAAWLSAKPARGSFTYGYRRVEILAAQANGISLLLLAAWFASSAVRRLLGEPEVSGAPILVVAIAGIAVNVLVTWLVSRADRESLNVKAAFQHMLTDLFAFVATALAGLVVMLTGWVHADAVATLLVVLVMLWSGAGLVVASWRVFLEMAPEGYDVEAIDAALHAAPGVVDVHDLHVWEVTSGFPALSVHILVAPEVDCHDVQHRVTRLLADEFGVEHSTLQVDHSEPSVIPAESLHGRSLHRHAGGDQ